MNQKKRRDTLSHIFYLRDRFSNSAGYLGSGKPRYQQFEFRFPDFSAGCLDVEPLATTLLMFLPAFFFLLHPEQIDGDLDQSDAGLFDLLVAIAAQDRGRDFADNACLFLGLSCRRRAIGHSL